MDFSLYETRETDCENGICVDFSLSIETSK